jgi:hypothetical protein
MRDCRRFLESLGLPPGDLHGLPDSQTRFADGARYRIEIPSCEGPRCLEALLDTAARMDVRVHRASQGSGVFMLTDAELAEMAAMAHTATSRSASSRVPTRPGTRRVARSPAGGAVAAASRGQEQIVQGLADARRAAAAGVRSVLIADVGLLDVFAEARRRGFLPADMQAKVSVMLPVFNPTARALVRLGADTLNLTTDLSLAQIAAIRAVVDVPLDIYVEVPDNVGGFVRLHEIPEIVRVAAPVYLKFGLRNAPDVYPAGTHLEATTVALTRERVRRARIGMELLAREWEDCETSELGARGLALVHADA